jgi:uncharacterized membrane protein YedE/YeeE
MLLNALALLCALLIGYAAHRASLCNVRAVAELLGSGSGHMLWSLVQAVLWMAALTGVLVLGFGFTPQPAAVRTPLAWAMAGGWLFGVGAAVNGGCSLSTLHRLADGELGMLATLAAFALGVSLWPSMQSMLGAAEVVSVPSPWLRWGEPAPWLLALLLAWVLLQLRVLRQLARRRRATLRERLLAPAYHLSVAAAVMGLAGGLLYAAQGAWSYTNYLRNAVLHGLGEAGAPTGWHGLLVIGLMAGMVLSARLRGAPGWRRPAGAGAWLRHATGGALMGAGAAMVPGGNDTLLLSALPALTAAAAAAYACMLLGIASVIWGMRLMRLPMPAVACTPSGCEERAPSAASGAGR